MTNDELRREVVGILNSYEPGASTTKALLGYVLHKQREAAEKVCAAIEDGYWVQTKEQYPFIGDVIAVARTTASSFAERGGESKTM